VLHENATASADAQLIQAAGHELAFHRLSEGMLVKESTAIERATYEALVNTSLERFAPRCFRSVDRGSHVLLYLEDLTSAYSRPCVMDVKMGTRTFQEDVAVRGPRPPPTPTPPPPPTLPLTFPKGRWPCVARCWLRAAGSSLLAGPLLTQRCDGSLPRLHTAAHPERPTDRASLSAQDNPKRRVDLMEKMIKLPDGKAALDEEERVKGVTKLRYMQFRENLSTSATKGWRIEGMHIARVGKYDVPKTLREDEEVLITLGNLT
jgi:hypothetical protein